MKKFSTLNVVFGWICFLTALTVYMLTLQPTVSFWDCGEFISTAYHIQVGHQPGAPLFLMIGKMFSLLAAEKDQVAFWMNTGSAVASAATIMFLFWTITALARKAADETKLSSFKQQLIVLSAGLTGALAYTFSDSFWFSAVEAEVYSLSSLCTAVTFWAILRWDAEANEATASRWLLFIAYLTGLSLGIHLLSLLTIPAIAVLYYFKKNTRHTTGRMLLALLAGCAVLGFIQFVIVQYMVLIASKFELFFVNSLGLMFGSGAIFFGAIIVASLAGGIIYSLKKNKPGLNLALLSISFILIGYSSYALLIIRASAKTSINISNPDNAFSLLGYLSREQYGDTPLFYGPYFDSQVSGTTEKGKLYRKGDNKYEIAGSRNTELYDRTTIFPRIYSQRPDHIPAYRRWLGLSENEKATFTDNLKFFFSYQTGFMYMRYFLWNFAGKQNDNQGYGERTNGNWLSGIKPLDQMHLGSQDQLPLSITQNKGYNRFFALPLIIGLIGLLFHFKKRRSDAIVITILFFFTGLAIILYLNQGPQEVRERDYAYVGSFYAFAIWIGMGVPGLINLFKRIAGENLSISLSVAGCLLAAPVIMATEGWDDHNRSDNYIAHDMAVNYLQSCAPNAILFTNADNDTYPLWYVQEVEGVRPDVRIVNLQLIYDDSYIDQLKKKLHSSAPLPLTMAKDKYRKGTRDFIPFADYGLSDSVELKDLFDVLISDNENDKVEMQDGSRMNFLPTKKFRITVDKKQIVKTGTVNQSELSNVADKMEWTFPGSYLTRADLALIDILAHNNWKRPVYFATSLPDDSYFGLDRYLYLEGYAYRLLPFNGGQNNQRNKPENINVAALYSNIISKFKLDSFKKASYLDPESKRVSRNTWDTMNTLAANLIADGKQEMARKVMAKALKVLPQKDSDLIDTANKIQTALNLYNLKEPVKANQIILSATSFIHAELKYYSSLNTEDQRYSAGAVQYAFSVLENFRKIAEENDQRAVDQAIRRIYSGMDGKFAGII